MTNLDPQDEQLIHDGRRFKVHRARFGPDRTREWVSAPASVAVVAYDDTSVYLVRQPREAVQRDDVLELPAGIMDVPGESPQQTARRELIEEIGMDASEWAEATSFFASIGFTDEIVHVFLATGLTKVGDPDESGEEQIEVVAWPLDALDALIDGNTDAKTLIGLLWLRRARLLGGSA
ncbi:MAG: NUDIX hydrolase [Actinomycetota bacterium]|nr:NUDIX hydrolase [Actinomycetota bacterium]MDQ5808981.1 NUDIX hydrolase [Actinomycetota bacterium]